MVMDQIANSEEPNLMFAHRIMKLLMCCQRALDSHAFIFAVCAGLRDRPLLEPFDILRICCSLVTYDDELDTFRSAHLSVQEYLKGLNGYTWFEVNALAAEQCLSWMLSRDKMLPETRLLRRNMDRCRLRAGRSSFDEHVDIFWPLYATEAGELRKTSKLRLLFREFMLHERASGKADIYGEWSNRLNATSDYSTPQYHFFEQCWSFPPDPLFTACAFDFSELIPDLLIDTIAFYAKNFVGHTCAQIALLCLSKKTLREIFNSRERLNIEDKYWPALLYFASSFSRDLGFKIALDVFGSGFVTEEVFKELVSRNFSGNPGLGFLPLVLKNNQELRVTEEIIQISLQYSNYNPKATEELLKYTEGIEITVKLINSALEIGQPSHPSMLAILESKEAGKKSHRNSPLPSGVEFSKTCYDNNHEVSAMLMARGPGALEVTWKDVMIAKKLSMGRESIALLLGTRPKIAQPAITMLVSLWDEDMVRELFAFQRVETTPDVIRAAAGNLKSGAKIMNLLLERETEDYV